MQTLENDADKNKWANKEQIWIDQLLIHYAISRLTERNWFTKRGRVNDHSLPFAEKEKTKAPTMPIEMYRKTVHDIQSREKVLRDFHQTLTHSLLIGSHIRCMWGMLMQHAIALLSIPCYLAYDIIKLISIEIKTWNKNERFRIASDQ